LRLRLKHLRLRLKHLRLRLKHLRLRLKHLRLRLKHLRLRLKHLRLRLNHLRLRLNHLRLRLNRCWHRGLYRGLVLSGLGLDLRLRLHHDLRRCADNPLALTLCSHALAWRWCLSWWLGLRRGLPAGTQVGRHVAH